MAELDLQDIHDTLVSIAYDAGRMILSANPTDIDQGTKLNCKFLPLGKA
jgi:myo-inositol-1(or 4)-monophosphatase